VQSRTQPSDDKLPTPKSLPEGGREEEAKEWRKKGRWADGEELLEGALEGVERREEVEQHKEVLGQLGLLHLRGEGRGDGAEKRAGQGDCGVGVIKSDGPNQRQRALLLASGCNFPPLSNM